jgi:hypothetical protein
MKHADLAVPVSEQRKNLDDDDDATEVTASDTCCTTDDGSKANASIVSLSKKVEEQERYIQAVTRLDDEFASDLMALQNAAYMVQQRAVLAEEEAALAVQDMDSAREVAVKWKQRCSKLEDKVRILTVRNDRLQQRNERLVTEKRVLVKAYKELQQKSKEVVRNQVEHYIEEALTAHEVHLKKSRPPPPSTTMEDLTEDPTETEHTVWSCHPPTSPAAAPVHQQSKQSAIEEEPPLTPQTPGLRNRLNNFLSPRRGLPTSAKAEAAADGGDVGSRFKNYLSSSNHFVKTPTAPPLSARSVPGSTKLNHGRKPAMPSSMAVPFRDFSERSFNCSANYEGSESYCEEERKITEVPFRDFPRNNEIPFRDFPRRSNLDEMNQTPKQTSKKPAIADVPFRDFPKRRADEMLPKTVQVVRQQEDHSESLGSPTMTPLASPSARSWRSEVTNGDSKALRSLSIQLR